MESPAQANHSLEFTIPREENTFRKDLLALVLICVLTFLAYSNSFHGEFQFDDERLIRFNFALRDLSLWKDILRFELFRPLTLFTYALNFQISGKNPWSYHFFNFGFHLLATGLFYVFLRRIHQGVLLCFFSAALFAVHPLNTEAVSYIASRPILLCAVFYLAALLCFDSYVRKSSRGSLPGYWLFFVLGLLSKEEAALVPAAALLYNYIQFGKGSVKKHIAFHVISLFAIACLISFRLTYFVNNLTPETVMSYFSTEVTVWFRYLWLAIFPIPLNVDHDIAAVHVTSWKFLVSLSATIAILWLLFKVRKNHSWLSLFGIWFFLNLAASSFIPLNDFMAEHRVYLSMLGFCACVAYATQVKRTSDRLLIFSLVCLLLFNLAATWKRNEIWQTKLTLWADAVEKSPQKFRPHLNFAFALFQRQEYQLAGQEYEKARSLNPVEPRIHTGLGFTFLEMGQLQSAETSFRIALRLDPEYIDAKTGLGILHYRKHEYEDALRYFLQTYPQRKESAELVAMIANSYLEMHQNPPAIAILKQASLWNARFGQICELVEGAKYDAAKAQLQGIISAM